MDKIEDVAVNEFA